MNPFLPLYVIAGLFGFIVLIALLRSGKVKVEVTQPQKKKAPAGVPYVPVDKK